VGLDWDCFGTILVYTLRMTVQIALRLPEEVVAFIDAEVDAGRAKSRADLVARCLQRDIRRRRAANDVEVLLRDRTLRGPDDLDALAVALASTTLDID
jgi:Arc/MetJ-type ribon-helix-helix transcriptional regulator